MRISFATPRSISAIKVKASKLRKATPSLTQSQALDLIAKDAGFSNYVHAKRQLPEVMHLFTLRCRWRDGKDRGDEVLRYPLPWTPSEVLSMRLRGARIGWFEAYLDDGLIYKDIVTSQQMARDWLVQALRELLVIEATGLRPDYVGNRVPARQKEYAGTKYLENDAPPGSDHLTAWYDPVSKDTLLMDQPYMAKAAVHHRAADRADWCRRYNYREKTSNWGGTQLPPKSRLFLFAERGKSINLDSIEAMLMKLPDDFGSYPEDWKGSSEALPSLTKSHTS